jgi:phage terminase Nu1 subunit (DNA packaging protein)
MSENSQKPTITASDLCTLTGLTDRRHRQLAAQGFFPPPLRGEYERDAVIAGMLRFYREIVSGGTGRKAERQARTRLTRARARELEFTEKIRIGNYVSTEEVERAISQCVVQPLRPRILSLDTTLDVRCNPEHPEIARTALRQWADETLKLLREKLEWQVEEDKKHGL